MQPKPSRGKADAAGTLQQRRRHVGRGLLQATSARAASAQTRSTPGSVSRPILHGAEPVARLPELSDADALVASAVVGARDLMRRWRNVALAAAVAAIALLLAGGCSEGPPGNLRFIQPDAYIIDHPSPDRASATGKGCAFTVSEAEQRAREVSEFNLRRLTGQARYRVEYTRISETQGQSETCVELTAHAVPSRLQ
jgi:hypothetical protein